MINWHRLFGLAVTDFFADSLYVVELEKDLSLRQQFLDVVILKKQPGTFAGRLPDGLDNLAEHNLLSYKSFQEPLDDWTLDELLGHFVNYRKQVSSARSALLSKNAFRLYGVSTRFPQKLADQVALTQRQAGVYEVRWGTTQLRVIVLREVLQAERNALWLLFSGLREQVAYGATQYQTQATDRSTILNQLFEKYQLEGLNMPYTMEDFRRDYVRDHLDLLTPEEILQRLPMKEVLQQLPVEELKAYLAQLERQSDQDKDSED